MCPGAAAAGGDSAGDLSSDVTVCPCAQVRQLREEILQEKPAGVPIVVVANKCDLEESRQVADTHGSLVELEWEHGFVQTSAKENINIVQVSSPHYRHT